jgi:hypothetical protein
MYLYDVRYLGERGGKGENWEFILSRSFVHILYYHHIPSSYQLNDAL